jgi:hypothetical protein
MEGRTMTKIQVLGAGLGMLWSLASLAAKAGPPSADARQPDALPRMQLAAFWDSVRAQDDEEWGDPESGDAFSDSEGFDEAEEESEGDAASAYETGEPEALEQAEAEPAQSEPPADASTQPAAEEPATGVGDSPASPPAPAASEPPAPSPEPRPWSGAGTEVDCDTVPHPQPCDTCNGGDWSRRDCDYYKSLGCPTPPDSKCDEPRTQASHAPMCPTARVQRGYCSFGRRLIVDAAPAPQPCVAAASGERPAGFRAEYCPVAQPSHGRVRSALQQGEILEDLVTRLNASLRLPRDVTVSLGECGHANAYYFRGTRSIQICYELVDAYQALYASDGLRDAALATAVDRALTFVFYQKLASALIDVLDLPMQGNEAAAADQIATFLLAGRANADASIALDGADALFRLVSQQRIAPAQAPGAAVAMTPVVADPSASDDRRLADIRCWVSGQQAITASPAETAGQASACTVGWMRLERAWARVLESVLLM